MHRFYVGVHQPSDGKYLGPAFVSVARLMDRRSRFTREPWIMDSNAYMQVSRTGRYSMTEQQYAVECTRWHQSGGLVGAMSQDYMCEKHVLDKTGLSVREHQSMTVARYQRIYLATNCPILPVLQGYEPEEYVRHIGMYGHMLESGMYVGVGSLCKRSGNPAAVYAVLAAIADERPDLRLHALGVKITCLEQADIRALLYSSDSMAWSDAARKEGRNANAWQEACLYSARVNALLARDVIGGVRSARSGLHFRMLPLHQHGGLTHSAEGRILHTPKEGRGQ